MAVDAVVGRVRRTYRISVTLARNNFLRRRLPPAPIAAPVVGPAVVAPNAIEAPVIGIGGTNIWIISGIRSISRVISRIRIIPGRISGIVRGISAIAIPAIAVAAIAVPAIAIPAIAIPAIGGRRAELVLRVIGVVTVILGHGRHAGAGREQGR
jgi:hypothetical protein